MKTKKGDLTSDIIIHGIPPMPSSKEPKYT